MIGWDIGGVNVKACRLRGGNSGHPIRLVSRPFEIWKDRDRLPAVLRDAYAEVCPEAESGGMALTMSAELSDVFATKREGVLFVFDSVRRCFPLAPIYCLDISGHFCTLEEARTHPLDFAAANWLASAHWIARKHPNGILMDVGSTTTDIIPLLRGEVHARGRTDTERLMSGELVYTGVLRTNLAAIVQSVPVSGRTCRVASEYFAVSGDVHLVLGHIGPEDYTATTPDNRPPTVDSAMARLARLVCADTEGLERTELEALARHIYREQVSQIRSGLEQVLVSDPELRAHPVLVCGSGAFLGREAARDLGLEVREEGDDLDSGESALLPCLAAASLLDAYLRESA